MMKKEYEEAIGYFTHILEANPTHANTLFCLSLSLFKLGRYESALENIDKGIQSIEEKLQRNDRREIEAD